MANPYTNPDEPGFNPAYRGTPPWDIGRPQPDFVRLEAAGEIEGSVLDVGCGTGEHVLYLAARGHDAWGVDLTSLAQVLASGGTYFVLGYSDDDPGPGPRGFSPDDLRAAFAEGWHINYVRATQFAINEMPLHKSRAWLASIRRA